VIGRQRKSAQPQNRQKERQPYLLLTAVSCNKHTSTQRQGCCEWNSPADRPTRLGHLADGDLARVIQLSKQRQPGLLVGIFQAPNQRLAQRRTERTS
jgi:hypothetical protein